LAHRLSDPDEVKSGPSGKRPVSASGHQPSTNPSYKSSMPMALRSAHNDMHDAFAKRTPDVDTFDVIGAPSDDEMDPWDRAAADALAGLYEREEANFAAKTQGAANPVAPLQSQTNVHSGGGSSVDQMWLDKKFAEIAQGIEQSLAAMRPESGISQISERLDQFERQFAKLFEGVATHDDLAAVHLIEQHVAEVVNHLVQTQDQLERLNIIEAQLASISHTLADVQGVPIDSDGGAAAPSRVLDYDAIARAAAEQTARRMADLRADDRHSAADELRPLIERLMSQNRQGEEQTAALLDTMQQVMIRLLDRVDSIESGQRAASQAPAPAPLADSSTYHAGMYGSEGTAPSGSLDDTASLSLDAAVAELASAKAPEPATPSRPRGRDASFEEAARSAAKSREDFVAEARRAKKRLAEQEGAAGRTVSASMIADEPAIGAAPAGPRPIRPAAAPTKKASGPSGPSPRLMVIAAVALLALGGLWYTFGFGKARVGSLSSEQQIEAVPSPQANGEEPGGSSDAAKSATDAQAPAANPDDAADPAKQDGKPHGELVPGQGSPEKAAFDAAPRRTALPMLGVAVDLDQPVTAEDIEQAKRHQAMAEISGELGYAAARSADGAAVPASMVPSDAETEVGKPPMTTGSVPPSASKSSPLDMPPATVGPLSLRLAAANGDPSAEFEVGARLAEGKGTAQSFKDAAKWYQRSADQGFAQSQYRLGTLYERGLGLKADRAQAAIWYQRAAQQGNIKAMHNLAVLSANQSDQSPDYMTAAQWFEEAAQRGLADSQFNLAVLYENGLGVKRDMSRAFMWLAIAARGGDPDAVRRRDILRGKLTAEELAAANKMIAEWKPMASTRMVNDARAAGEMWKNNPKNGMNG